MLPVRWGPISFFNHKMLIGINNILFIVLLTYYDIYIHTIFLEFGGKR